MYICFKINTYMTIKLTLTVEESVIEAAKVYARQRGESISHLVEQYLRSLTTKDIKCQKADGYNFTAGFLRL